MSVAAIHIEGLSKTYDGDRAALSALDLQVDDGELLALVGPSGCGKSTVLRLIAGLEIPDAGRIALGGKSLAGVAPQDRDVAMVFQGYALYPHLSVRDNIAFPLKMRGVGEAERRRRVEEIAALVGLSDKLSRLPSALSGGERQRVAMGRAIVREPRLFLFDEPLSNLDAKLRAELRVELAALVRRLGTTSIYVTHDQAEAMTMADRVAVLDRGALMQLATPRDLYVDPDNTFVAGFVGTPMMNLLRVTREGSEAVGRSGRLPLPAWLEGDAFVAGFRPEHARLQPDGEGLRAEVRVVEPLGAETIVYLHGEDGALRVRLPGFADRAIGEALTVTVAPEHVLWFDGDGARLRERA